MKIKLLLFALFFLFVIPFRSYAACSFSVNGTTNTVTSSCSFDNAIDGIDMGTTTVVNGQTVPVNSSILKIAGGTVTIGATQQIAIGSVNLTGGSLAIIAGGKMLLNTPMWYNDSDGDGTVESTVTLSRTLPAASAVRVNLGIPSTLDCNVGGAVSIPHAQCYTDADIDGYTNGLAANTTCLNAATCAAATKSSASTNGATVAGPFAAGTLRDAVGTTDCNDANASLFRTVNGYLDSDGDGYGAGALATCVGASGSYVANNTDCNNANAAIFRTVAGYLDSDGDGYGAGAYATCVGASGSYVANASDCYDSNANAKPGQVTYYGSSRGDGSYDFDCDGVATKSPAAVSTCVHTGCAAHYFTTTVGWTTAAPACGVGASWSTYSGVGGSCTTYAAGAGVTCPAATTSTVVQSCR